MLEYLNVLLFNFNDFSLIQIKYEFSHLKECMRINRNHLYIFKLPFTFNLINREK